MSGSEILTWFSDGDGSEIGGSLSDRPTSPPASTSSARSKRVKTYRWDISPAYTGCKTARANQAARLRRSPLRPPPPQSSVDRVALAPERRGNTPSQHLPSLSQVDDGCQDSDVRFQYFRHGKADQQVSVEMVRVVEGDKKAGSKMKKYFVKY